MLCRFETSKGKKILYIDYMVLFKSLALKLDNLQFASWFWNLEVL